MRFGYITVSPCRGGAGSPGSVPKRRAVRTWGQEECSLGTRGEAWRRGCTRPRVADRLAHCPLTAESGAVALWSRRARYHPHPPTAFPATCVCQTQPPPPHPLTCGSATLLLLIRWLPWRKARLSSDTWCRAAAAPAPASPRAPAAGVGTGQVRPSLQRLKCCETGAHHAGYGFRSEGGSRRAEA